MFDHGATCVPNPCLEHFYFSIYWEESFQLTNIFQKGLKPPNRKKCVRSDSGNRWCDFFHMVCGVPWGEQCPIETWCDFRGFQ